MKLYQCTLTLHDNVFFATREMGILYETEKYLHNWALSYSMFGETHIPRPYRLQGATAQKPGYLDATNEQNLLQLNDAGIYVFPAQPVQWSYQVNTFKAAQVSYYGRSKQFGDKGADRNYPINYGRAKELAVGSTYRTYVVSQTDFSIPNWIRLGKWAAKIQVSSLPIKDFKLQSGEFICTHPINPIDLPTTTRLKLYNRIIMPPVSLVSQAQLEGTHWRLPGGSCIPADVSYGASYVAV
ncbi:type I-D CRISPR-associated protein Cas5/Csc1 [Cyanobacteria bacterium FACHB-63]|nr:type I-D CRISPR-associated protein Cas5/Csc1 [Cyanobacteria bacterium FACHB-63]